MSKPGGHYKKSGRPNKSREIKPHNKPGLASRLTAATLLTRVVDDGRNLDALCDLEHGLDAYLKLSANDRSLARAIAVTALRHRNSIDAAIRSVVDRPLPRNARFLLHMLHQLNNGGL